MDLFVSRSNAGDAVVFRHLSLFVAEVTRSTNKKAAERMAAATRLAREVESLAPELECLMEHSTPVADLLGPRAARELRSLRQMKEPTDAFGELFPDFMREHGVLVKPEAAAIANHFVAWLPTRMAELTARVREFEKRVAQDLKENASVLASLCEEWSATDADGLTAG